MDLGTLCLVLLALLIVAGILVAGSKSQPDKQPRQQGIEEPPPAVDQPQEELDTSKVEGLQTVTAPETPESHEPAETPEPTEPAEPTPPPAAETTQISEEMLKIISIVVAGGKGKNWGVGSLYDKVLKSLGIKRAEADSVLTKLEKLGVLGSFVEHKGRECIMTPEILQTLLDLGTLKVIKTEIEQQPKEEPAETTAEAEEPVAETEQPVPEPAEPEPESATTAAPTTVAQEEKPVIDDDYRKKLEYLKDKETFNRSQVRDKFNLSNQESRQLRDRFAGDKVIKKQPGDKGRWLVVSEVVEKLLKQPTQG